MTHGAITCMIVYILYVIHFYFFVLDCIYCILILFFAVLCTFSAAVTWKFSHCGTNKGLSYTSGQNLLLYELMAILLCNKEAICNEILGQFGAAFYIYLKSSYSFHCCESLSSNKLNINQRGTECSEMTLTALALA